MFLKWTVVMAVHIYDYPKKTFNCTLQVGELCGMWTISCQKWEGRKEGREKRIEEEGGKKERGRVSAKRAPQFQNIKVSSGTLPTFSSSKAHQAGLASKQKEGSSLKPFSNVNMSWWFKLNDIIITWLYNCIKIQLLNFSILNL